MRNVGRFITLGVSAGGLAVASLNGAIAANDSPQAFTLQGALTNQDGTAPLTDSNVTLTVGIYDPTGTCLLYEESQSGIDLSQTSGLFAIQVGSFVGDAKRVAGMDPGLPMSSIYANGGTQIRASGAHCAPGYTSSPGDVRMMRITVNAASIGTVTLSPDQTLSAVPQALVAQTLQGKDPSQFLQIDAASNLSQATVETLTNASDASSLHNHDSLYVKLGTGGSQNLGSGSFYTSGSLGVGMGSAPAGISLQVDASSSSTKGLVIQGAAGQTANLFEVDNAASTPLVTIDRVGDLALSSNTTFGLGTFAAPRASCAQAGQLWYAAGTLQFCDGSLAVQTLALSGSGMQSLNGLTAGAQTLAIGTSGNAPNWSSATSTHTLNIPMASSSSSVTAGLLSNAEYAALSAKVDGKSNLTTTGALPYVSSSGTLNQDGSNLFWDSSNHRLGIGTSSPSARLHLAAGTNVQAALIITGAGSSLLTTPVEGAIEFDRTNLYFTDSTPTRRTIATQSWVNSQLSGYQASGSYATLSGGNAFTGANSFSSSSGPATFLPYGSSAGETSEVRFSELAANGTSYVGFKAPDSIAASKIWTLPATDGSSGQVLKTDGAGNLSWITPSTGSVTSVSGTAPISSSGGTTPTISISQSSSTTNGYLSSGDWSTFNGKVGGASNLTSAGAITQVTSAGAITQSTGLAASTTANVASLGISAGSAQGTTPMLQVSDDSGNSLFTILKTGLMSLFNQKAVSGVTQMTVQSGAGQGTTPSTKWIDNAGTTTLYAINPAGSASNSYDVANKGDVASILSAQLGSYLPLAGGTMSGAIAMGSHKVTGVTDPTAAQDAATKNYVDTSLTSKVSKSGDTMTGQLKFNTPATADSAAQVLVATGADSNKGIVVQANSGSQSGNLTEWQSSTGTVLAKVDASGNFTAANFSGAGYSQSSGNFTMAGTGTFSTGTGAVSLNGATSVASNQSLTMASGSGQFTQTYNGSGPAHSITDTASASGDILDLTTTSTAALTGDKALNVSVSGANSSSSVTRYGMYSNVTASGTSSTNVAGYFNATGATNNYALIAPSGNVGIGTTTPVANLDVAGGLKSGAMMPASLTTLSAGATASDTSITVGSTSGYPTSGILYIYNTSSPYQAEVVSYTGVTAGTFTGLSRGLYGSTAIALSSGYTVDQCLNCVGSSASAPKFFQTQGVGLGIGALPPAWMPSGGAYSNNYFYSAGSQITSHTYAYGTSSVLMYGNGVSSTSDYWWVTTNKAPRIYLDGSGNVGINQMAPRGAFEVGGAPNTILSAAINSSTTSLTVAANSFPASGTLIIDSEQMTYTGGGTTSLTVTRGANSTTAASHSINTPVGYYGASSLMVSTSGNVGIGTTGPSVSLDLGSRTDAIRLPAGTTAQEPSSPSAGMLRWNSSNAAAEIYNGSGWLNLGTTSSGGAYTNVSSITGGSSGVSIAAGGTNQSVSISGSGTGGVALNSSTTVAANQNFSMASGSGQFSQTYTGSGPAASITDTSAASGDLLDLTTTSTAAANNDKAVNVGVSGANATSSITRYGVYSNVTATGTSSTNVAGYFAATGATNNYGLLVPQGNVGIGTTSPTALMQIEKDGIGTTTTDGLYLANSTAGIATQGQNSPALHFLGNSYDSSTSSSKAVEVKMEALGANNLNTGPSIFDIAMNIGGSGWTNILTINRFGNTVHTLVFNSGSLNSYTTTTSNGSYSASTGPVDGLITQPPANATATTLAVYSPRLRMRSSAWDTSATAAKTHDWIFENIPVSGNPTSSSLNFEYSYAGGATSTPMTLLTSGAVGVGTTTPRDNLEVAGSARVSTATNASTTITTAALATDTSFVVGSTVGYPSYGTLKVESEYVTYTSTDATHFYGLTRAQNGTTAAAHAIGKVVSVAIFTAGTQSGAVPTYLFLNDGSFAIGASSSIGAPTTYGSYAIGNHASASGGAGAYAIGPYSVASGSSAISIGYQSLASGKWASALGYVASASSYTETVVGEQNLAVGSENNTSRVATSPIFVVGNGVAGGTSSNAYVQHRNGQAIVNPGTFTSSTTPTLVSVMNSSMFTSVGSTSDNTAGALNASNSGGTSLFYVRNDGNVGIGTTGPSYQLQLSTDSAAKPGTSTWTIASDKRLKDIHGSFERGLDALEKIHPIYFNYKKDNALDLPADKQYVGIIAQDAQKAVPEAVQTDDKGYLHVTNDAIIWTILNSVKELYHKFTSYSEAQDREIASVKAENARLKKENEEIRQRLDRIEKALKEK